MLLFLLLPLILATAASAAGGNAQTSGISGDYLLKISGVDYGDGQIPATVVDLTTMVQVSVKVEGYDLTVPMAVKARSEKQVT